MTGYSAPREGYRWTCPFCGASRLNTSGNGSGEANAIAALRTHVLASDGSEHGPKHGYPAEFIDVTLADYVEKVDGRGNVVNTEE